MRARLLFAICAALAAVAVTPAAASACASLAGVHAFTGHARMTFTGTASGPITGSGGSETITLQRSAASVEIKLTHKTMGKGQFAAIVFFVGKARLGNVSVNDSFDLGGSGSYAKETYAGPLLASLGAATLALDTDDCKYQILAHFGARTMFSGDAALQPGDSVFGTAYGDRYHIPKNLHLNGGVGPTAYLSCPGNPLLTGNPCFQIGGGWAVDFAELSQCGSYPPHGNCASTEKPVGSAEFIWDLKSK